MSALLDDIINLAEDDKQSLPNLLRKCLRLASELKIERLKSWADQELNGYKDGDEVPAYRIIGAHAYGNFMGWNNTWYPNHLIVPAVMEPNHRKYAEQAYLVQSVGALDDLAKMDAAKGAFTSPWPPNMFRTTKPSWCRGTFVMTHGRKYRRVRSLKCSTQSEIRLFAWHWR